jgi:hypothetical protein
MKNMGDASIEFVQECIASGFTDIFGSIDGLKEPSHLLNDVEWYEADDGTGVYPLLICEPIENIPNNIVCLCPPFNKTKYI